MAHARLETPFARRGVLTPVVLTLISAQVRPDHRVIARLRRNRVGDAATLGKGLGSGSGLGLGLGLGPGLGSRVRVRVRVRYLTRALTLTLTLTLTLNLTLTLTQTLTLVRTASLLGSGRTPCTG